MKPLQPTYIQLDNAEDVPSVRDRFSFIRGKHVLLIWPETGTALNRKLDLVLLQREARRRVLQLALVTHDDDVIKHAEELGISTFETIQQAEAARWKRGRTRVFVNRHHKPEDTPEPEDLMPIASRVRKSRKRMPPLVQTTVRIIILTIVLGVILGALYITVPSASVSFTMEQELIQVSTTITADPNALDIDVENRIIPATRYEVLVQTQQQIETTGSEQGTSTRAIGSVIFTNNTNSPIVVPFGTQVSTSTGESITFETTLAVTVPANGSIDDVGIIATEAFAGEIGNVGIRTINNVVGTLSDSLSVTNDVATINGSSESYQVVAPEDMERIMGDSRQSLQVLGFSEIAADIGDTQTIIIESVNIPNELLRNDWITYSHTIDDRTDFLTLNIQVIVEALVIDDRLAQQVVFAQVSSQKPDDMVLNPESFLYLRGPVIETDADNLTTFEAFGEGIASAQVDIYNLQSDLTRRPIDEAQRLIAATVDIAANSQPLIEVSPAWIQHMPFLPVRITIEIEGNE